MTEEEKLAKEAAEKLEAKLDKKIKEALDKKDAGSVSDEEYQKLLKKCEKMQEDLEGLQSKIKTETATKSFSEQIGEQLEAKSGDLLKLMEGKTSEKVLFETKAADTIMVLGGVGGNYDGTYALTAAMPGISTPARRRPFLRQLMNSFSTNKPKVYYVELVSRDGEAGMTAEGAKKSQIDFKLAEATADVKKVTAFVKASKESLDDIPYLRSLITNELVSAIYDKLDTQLYSGDGLGSNLKGLTEYASNLVVSSSVNSSFYQSIPFANRFDVIQVARAIMAAETFGDTRFEPTHVILNPVDQALMQFAKDKNGNYVIPPFGSADMLSTTGISYVANPLVSLGTFIIADMSKSRLAIRESINISVGTEEDDFTKNLVTILAEMRAGHFVKSNETPAIRKGVFADLIAAINQGTPS